MRRMITFAFMMTMVVMMAHAQGGLKKCIMKASTRWGRLMPACRRRRPRASLWFVSWGQLVSMVPEVCRFRREGYGCEPDDG